VTQILILNLVFFVPAICGAAVSAWLVMRYLRAPAPPSGGDGGTDVVANDRPRAGPDDLAHSA
jgi:hypothetical protein